MKNSLSSKNNDSCPEQEDRLPKIQRNRNRDENEEDVDGDLDLEDNEFRKVSEYLGNCT